MAATEFNADRRSILGAGALAVTAIASEMGDRLATPRNFAPVAWLARFEAAGGAAWVASGKMAVGWRVDGCTDNKQALAREIYGEIERDDGNRKEVEDILRAWEMAVFSVAEKEAVERRAYTSHVQPVIDAHGKGLATFDQVRAAEEAHAPYCTAHAHAINALALTPAPTLAALQLKVETAHGDGLFDGSSTCSAAIYAIQSDIGRLLG